MFGTKEGSETYTYGLLYFSFCVGIAFGWHKTGGMLHGQVVIGASRSEPHTCDENDKFCAYVRMHGSYTANLSQTYFNL